MDSLEPRNVELGVDDIIQAEVNAQFDHLTRDPATRNEKISALAESLHVSLLKIAAKEKVALSGKGTNAVVDNKPLYHTEDGYSNSKRPGDTRAKLVSGAVNFDLGINFTDTPPPAESEDGSVPFDAKFVEQSIRRALDRYINSDSPSADKNMRNKIMTSGPKFLEPKQEKKASTPVVGKKPSRWEAQAEMLAKEQG